MIITPAEIRRIEIIVELQGRELEDLSPEEFRLVTGWKTLLGKHPHWLFPLGFDEYTRLSSAHIERDPVTVKLLEELNSDDSPTDTELVAPELGDSLFRTPDGQWLRQVVSDSSVMMAPRDPQTGWFSSLGDQRYLYDVPAILDGIRGVDPRKFPETALLDPRLWTPERQDQEESALAPARQIIRAISAETRLLSDLHWRELEDIVAEILRARDLEIMRVKTHPQGGRDILARGTLIPGEEPITMAVEVKHHDVVDRPTVQTALYQNRQFPALLFVTSGRFTAGVIEERQLPENQLRLILKDGEALRDMLHAHPMALCSRRPGQ